MLWQITAMLHMAAAGTVPASIAVEPPRCSVGGATADSADEARALRACAEAQTRFADLFGAPAPRAHVVLHDAAGYEVALVQDVGVVFWPNSGALPQHASPEWRAVQWREVLRHEIMHALTMAYFYAGASAVDSTGYGTPLPDWFEEGIAIWGEPAASRAARLSQARSLPAYRLDVEAIVRGRHPLAGTPGLLASVPGAPVPRDEALRAFYPQSIALLTYIHDRGGAAAVQALGTRLRRDPAAADALAGLPGLPATMTAVAADWRAWLAEER
jgi:hypothetical protein